ncbi:lipase ATG15 [Pancytospora epiphaga]|nr:lipase ATG15 [Pancytospora epiphaga]
MRKIVLIVGMLKATHLNRITRSSMLDFAEMSAGAYGHDVVQNVLFGFTTTDGLNAQVYDYNEKIVIAFKGASPVFLGYSMGPNGSKDRKLVNTLFSRCTTEKCRKIQRETLMRHSYFRDGHALVRQVIGLFSGREIILTGHSLGGAIASVLAVLSDGISAVAISTPGEVHLLNRAEVSVASKKVIHFGACSDPIYRGRCFGPLSVCGLLNYHISTGCHSGITYCVDPGILGGIISHKISTVIEVLKNGHSIRDMHDSGCEPYGG